MNKMYIGKYYKIDYKDGEYTLFYMLQVQKNKKPYGVAISSYQRVGRFHSVLFPDLWYEIKKEEIKSHLIKAIEEKIKKYKR